MQIIQKTAKKVNQYLKKDFYSKFYNVIYEDDTFKEFKEALEKETMAFEKDFKSQMKNKVGDYCY